MADRTTDILSGGNPNDQTPIKNISASETHPGHATGTIEFNGKTYPVASGRGDKIFPSTSPGRFPLTDISGGYNPEAGRSALTHGAFRIGGTEPIKGDIETKDRPATIKGKPAGPNRTDQEIHPILHLHPGMPDKDLTMGCIGLVGDEHYKALEKDLKEAWGRGDTTNITVKYDQDGKMQAKVHTISPTMQHPDYASSQDNPKPHASENLNAASPISYKPQQTSEDHASPNPAQPAGREAMTGGPRSMVRPQGPTLARSDMSEGASRAHDESRVEPKPQDTKSTSGGNQTATGSSEGGGGPMGHAPYPEGPEYAGKVRQIESGGDDKNVTGPNVGRYQFSKDQFKKLDIDPKHPMDPEQQDKGLYNQNSQIAQAWRETHGGENPTPAQMYQMHQQGIAGTAALHDPKNKDRPADEVVAEAMGYDKAKAKKAIMAQTGSKDIVSGGMPTSGQFAEHWNKLYKDAKDDAKVKENQDKVHKFMHQNLFRGDTKKKEEKSGGEPKSNPQGSTDKSEDKSTTDKDKYKRLSDAKTLSKGKVMPGPNPANPYQNTSEFEYAVVTDSGAGDPTKQQRVQISPSSLAGVDPTSMPYAKTHVAHSQEAPTWNSPHSHKNGNIVKVRLDKQSGEWEIHGSPGTINT